MVSDIVAHVIEMYLPETFFKTIYLLEMESEVHATYFMPFLEEVDCLAEEHDEFSQEHIEKCLNKMLAAYVNGDRNYAVDCAKIECTEMCTLTHCIAYEKGKTRLYDVVKEGPGIERNYIPDGREEGERYFLGDREELCC